MATGQGWGTEVHTVKVMLGGTGLGILLEAGQQVEPSPFQWS